MKGFPGGFEVIGLFETLASSMPLSNGCHALSASTKASINLGMAAWVFAAWALNSSSLSDASEAVTASASERNSFTASRCVSVSAGRLLVVDQSGGAFSRRVLKLGRRGDALIEVTSGLSVGDKVVANGNLLIDGQAEMIAPSPTPATPATTNSLPALTDTQRDAVKEFLSLADAVTASLASDKLDEFNAQAAKTHAAMPRLMDAFVDADKAWHPLLKGIEEAGHLEKADDLKTARKTFHPFSNSAVALAQALRRCEKEFVSLKVFRCPMTKAVFPGAPAAAEWMQLQPVISNPYLGAQMLDCGAEVKP